MKKHLSFFKTTLLGGLVFLLPLVLLVTVVGKGIQIMMMVAEPLSGWLPVDSVGGIALVNLIALLVVLFACFFSGFAARSLIGKKLFRSVDSRLLAIPGYALFKARLTGNIGSELREQNLRPVMAHLGVKSQIGFAVERTADGLVAIFLPGTPDPWSGSIIFVKEDQVKPLNASMRETMHMFESLGKSAARLVESA